MTVVLLREYATTEVPLTDDQAAALSQAAGHRLQLLQSHRPGYRQLTATSYVGTLTAGGLEVRIRPKVPITNVLSLLSTAGPPPDWLTSQHADYATHRDALPAFALLYSHTLQATLAQGPLRGYREHTDELIALRGRIDLTAQLRHPDRRSPISCRYTDLTTDIAANRYIKHATHLLLRTPGIPIEARRICKHALQRFEEVAPDPPPMDLPERLTHTRLTRHYEPLLTLASLLRRSLNVSDHHGHTTAAGFLVDMNALFERFLEQALISALRGRLTVTGQHPGHLDRDRHVNIRPDLVFQDASGTTVLVGDAKYKLAARGIGPSSDYYQLLAYCTRYSTTDGLLLYASDGGHRPPRTVTVEPTGTRLHTIAIDLSGSAEQIEDRVQRLADTITALGTAQRASPPTRSDHVEVP